MEIMRISNPAQADALAAHRAPDPDRVGPGVWSVPVPLPGSSVRLPATLCYAIEDAEGGVHLIDPGFDAPDNREALRAGLKAAGHDIAEVRTVTATHMHDDHLGLAAHVREASGARVILAARELEDTAAHAEHRSGSAERSPEDPLRRLSTWGVPPEIAGELVEGFAHASELDHAMRGARPDLLVRDGDALPIAGRTVRVIASPGHTSGSICLIDHDAGLCFTGDTVLPKIHPGIGLGAPTLNPIGEYIASLRQLEAFDEYEACPGHEFRFTGLAERAREIADHHLHRSREVAAALAADDAASVWRVASQLHWSAGWGGLHGFVLVSALAQTEMHMRFVRAECLDG